MKIKLMSLILSGWIWMAPPLQAQNLVAQPEVYLIEPEIFEYHRYFAEANHLLAIRPEFLETILFGLIDLKGDADTAKKRIRQDILGCPMHNSSSRCPIDQLRRFHKENKIKTKFEIPLNYTGVEFHPEKSRTLVEFFWQPQWIEAEIWSIEEFRKYLNLAEESPYYQFKPAIKKIIFTPNLEKSFQITVDKEQGRILQTLYHPLPQDFRDQAIFELEAVSVSQDGEIASLNYFFRARQIRANHLVFTLPPFKKLKP